MSNRNGKLILVGDNPFHGVSHISRERAMRRGNNIENAEFATELVLTSMENGANGFTFTVSDTTLAIINCISKQHILGIEYYPLIPNVNELVRIAGSAGGIPGLAKEMASRMISARHIGMPLGLLNGALINNSEALFKSYITYEYLRLKRALEKEAGGYLKSILLHEIVTDMALALDMEWLFRAHIALMRKLGLKPGFETRNLPFMIKQFQKWQIDPAGMVIEAPFNATGFQMCPSQQDCEAALELTPKAEVVAFSVLAAGYLNPEEAFAYLSTLKGLSGVALGVSTQKQAVSTFKLAKQSLAETANTPVRQQRKQ